MYRHLVSFIKTNQSVNTV